MISDPSLLFYCCIAKGTTILAEYLSGSEPNIETVAKKCIENTPPYHSLFSHTIRGKSYLFLIDKFVYFGIFDENLDKSEALWYLSCVKDGLNKISVGRSVLDSGNLDAYLLQRQLDPIFRELLVVQKVKEFDNVECVLKDNRNVSIDSSRGKRMVSFPLLGKPTKGLKKKKRLFCESNGESIKDAMEKKVDVLDENDGLGVREFSLTSNKNSNDELLAGDVGRQKIKQMWIKHVWIVLMIDFCVCSLLFGIWLWICRGFKCIEG